MLTTKSADDGEEADAGGLTPAVLEARYEGTVNVRQSWLVKVFQSTIHALYQTSRLFAISQATQDMGIMK